MRIGQGWDRHRLVEGRPCILGGVVFPECGVGPLGHSDGDAVIHAVIDALLGAAALGDIGRHFPDTDERWRDAAGRTLLVETMVLIRNAGWQVGNVDVTVIAELPRIASRADQMADILASVLDVDRGAISIKATRGEGLGPEGRGECVTATAVALLFGSGREEGTR